MKHFCTDEFITQLFTKHNNRQNSSIFFKIQLNNHRSALEVVIRIDLSMTFSIHVRFVVRVGLGFLYILPSKYLLLLLLLLEAGKEAILKKDGAALLRNLR